MDRCVEEAGRIERRGKVLIREIRRDLRKTMGLSVVFYGLQMFVEGLLVLYSAHILGELADAVFRLDLQFGINYFWQLLACVGATVVIPPLVGVLGETTMFRNALTHERAVLSRFFKKSCESVKKLEEGEIQYRLEDDLIELNQIWVMLHTRYMAAPVLLVCLLYQVLGINLLFTVIAFIVSLGKLIVPVAVAKLMAKYDMESRSYEEQVRTLENELTTKPHIIKLYGLKESMIRKLDGLYQDYLHHVQKPMIRKDVISRNFSSFLDTFSILLILFFGAVLTAQGEIAAGDVAAMMGYLTVFDTLLGYAAYMIRNIPVYKNLLIRTEIFYEEGEEEQGEEIEEIEGIRAERLSISYGEKQIFENLSFQVRMGKTNVVLGKNGSGKSTLFKVLAGIKRDYEGSILIGDRQLRSLKIESWRSKIAYASQDSFLFAGNVLDNVCLGDMGARREDAEKVMEEIGILHLAERKIGGEDNGNLSGGERQKVSIARALMKKAPVLLLDEPDNHLDTDTLDWLRRFIASASCTVLYISHDGELADLADNQIIL